MEIKDTLAIRPALALQIRKRFDNSAFELNISAQIEPGTTIIFGPSGAGKTTLLECTAGLLTPNSGRIAIGDQIFFDSGICLHANRRRIGYVFQDLALFPHLSVKGNIQYGIRSLTDVIREQRTASIVSSFRISHLVDRKPAEISGGERQRVALARALVTDPCALLLDEPLAALDVRIKAKIVDDLRAWNEAHGIPILYVTHSREEVFAVGDRVIVLEDGKIVGEGSPGEIF